MTLRMVEIPGREAGVINGVAVKGLGAQCPYCSMVYDEFDYEKGDKLEFPNKCGRCTSPMGRTQEAMDFANEHAVPSGPAKAKPWPELELEKAAAD